jgi:hypothetical protein
MELSVQLEGVGQTLACFGPVAKVQRDNAGMVLQARVFGVKAERFQ